MTKLFGLLSLGIAFLICLGSVAAGDAPAKGKGKGKFKGDPETLYKKLDTNGDGKLTKDEYLKIADRAKDDAKKAKFQGFLEKAYAKMDPTNTNAVTVDQFKTYMESQPKRKKKSNN